MLELFAPLLVEFRIITVMLIGILQLRKRIDQRFRCENAAIRTKVSFLSGMLYMCDSFIDKEAGEEISPGRRRPRCKHSAKRS